MKDGILYLAVPYTHPDPSVMEARYKAVTHVAGELFKRGCPCFSPITHSHPIKVAAGLTGPWAEWAAYDTEVIRRLCNRVLVLMFDGWLESVGVQAEIRLAATLGLEVDYYSAAMFGLVAEYPYFPWHGQAYRVPPLYDDHPVPLSDYDYETE